MFSREYLYSCRASNFKWGRCTERQRCKRARQCCGVYNGEATGINCLRNLFHLQQRQSSCC